MVNISRDTFIEFINESIDELPKNHIQSLKNVAIIVEDRPSQEQLKRLNVAKYHTLYGLYEGIPLSQRQGIQKTLPDKITLFKEPLQEGSRNLINLKENIKHTLWHEIAHYYGLNHEQIKGLETD